MSVRMDASKIAAVLILFSAACGRVEKYSNGFMLDLAKAPHGCGDGRHIGAVAMGNRRVWLNAGPDISVSEVGLKLREIMKTRTERIAFVEAEADVSWGEFAELVDHIRPEVEIISLVTPQVEALARQRMCLAPSCGRRAKLREFSIVR